MEAKEPLAKEKEITPQIMMIAQKPSSNGFVPEISPYPTVVIVDIVQ